MYRIRFEQYALAECISTAEERVGFLSFEVAYAL